MTSKLNFDKLTWEEFQQLTVYLAQEVYAVPSFEEFLKKGSKQDGIDILSFDQTTGKFFTIQCKHVKTINPSKVRTILTEFEQGSFLNSSDRFLICTSADLQQTSIQNYLNEQKAGMRNTHGIELIIWDGNYLNSILAKYYRIVSHFFGIEDAEKHCHGKPFKKTKVFPQENFISRSISVLGQEKEDSMWSRRRVEKPIFLTELMRENPLLSRKVCLLADAYEGKSVLLKQTAYELSVGSPWFETILIELKSVNIRAIDEILEANFNTWRDTPSKDLLVVIDGLDEVPTDLFIETTGHIAEFIQKYPTVNIIFSCRKSFFQRYNLHGKLKHIEFFNINPLGYFLIEQYLSSKLSEQQGNAFNKKIKMLGISDFLHHPFYLVMLTRWFAENPRNLPSSKIDIVSKFIDESLLISADRKLSRGNLFLQRKMDYRKALKKLALAFQLAGLNAADEDFIQELFNPEQIELFQHSALLSLENGKWFFQNALLQEQLAALALIEEELKIFDFICLGEEIKKIRPKWVQTVASVISMLGEKDPLRESLVSIIKKDNIELLTYSDSSKFTSSFRLEILTTILNNCIQRSSRPIRIDEDDIAQFIGNNATPIRYLISLLRPDIHEVVKVTICRIIKEMALNAEQVTDYQEKALEELKSFSDPYYGKLLMNIFSFYGGTGLPVIKTAMERTDLLTKHEFREGIYKYLLAKNLVDEHYHFGLDGFILLVNYNKSIRHNGSEQKLGEFLLATKKPENLRKLYDLVGTGAWLSFYSHRTDALGTFVSGLKTTSTFIYAQDRGIIFPLIQLISKLGRQAIKDEFSHLGEFFRNTGTALFAIKILLLNPDVNYHYEFSNIIDHDCMSYLIYAHEEGLISRPALNSFRSGLYLMKKFEESSYFSGLIQDAFGKLEITEDPADKHYNHSQETKFQNDLKYIGSLESFREGAILFFSAYGRKSLPYEDLYIDYDSKPKRFKADSELMYRFLSDQMTDKKIVYLKDCLRVLEDPQQFEFIRAALILGFNFTARSGEEVFKSIAADYFNKEIPQANFKNAFLIEKNMLHWRQKELLLARLWKRFQMSSEERFLLELLWMDRNGMRGIEHHKLNKSDSISSLLVKFFDQKKQLLQAKVLANMRGGISDPMVLGTHIGLCRHLKLFEAVGLIYEALKSGKLEQELYVGVDIFLELGGEAETLLPVFLSIGNHNDHNFLHMVKVLYTEFPKEVSEVILLQFGTDKLTDDTKMSLAKYLSAIGEKKGFSFIMSKVRETRLAPYHIQSGFKICKVDTAWALSEIDDLICLLLVEEDNRSRFYETAKHFLLEVINDFAAKSEEDLLMVENFLRKKMFELAPDFKLAHHLLWYIERAIEDFRNSEVEPMKISKIKLLLGDF
ncbi:restriction endonuclease [Pedobacter sp. 22163]|uniref:restriction endonuclease n=1 Tax=Pedobacter sp. 22163 TaxID=3453883 RepID=UPI003F877322